MNMEKGTPHYSLNTIKVVVATYGLGAFTRTAQWGVVALGITDEEACKVILELDRSNFRKSMTTRADHRVWQDVYHASCPNGLMAYIKVTLQDGAVVIQFKEL
jgi:motility quorum-sensing regulator/GCU-specific mRNA interferase toxin